MEGWERGRTYSKGSKPVRDAPSKQPVSKGSNKPVTPQKAAETPYHGTTRGVASLEAPKTYKEQQVTWTARSEGWAITHAELINERTRLLTRLSQESNTTEIYRTQGRLGGNRGIAHPG